MATLENLVALANDYHCNEDGSWEKIEHMYAWIEAASACFDKFMEEMGIDQESCTGQAIQALSFEKLEQLIAKVSPGDDLIHVDNDGFSVNHGSVGSVVFFFF
jgi:hypothetical protein